MAIHMAGLKNLCVFNGTVYEIPLNKRKDGKIIETKLSKQTVLNVELVYLTQNRKPYELIRVTFNRITFDNNGVYDVEKAMMTDEFHVEMQYIGRKAFEGINSLGEDSTPLPIPRAPIIPSEDEINNLKAFLNQKYPLLMENSPYAIEAAIKKEQERHKERIAQMKKSYLTK